MIIEYKNKIKALLMRPSILKEVSKSLWKFLPARTRKTLRNYFKQFTNFKILAVDYGQLKSIKEWSCLDAKGEPIPWYTYPAIEYLDHIDLSGFNIFEYGSGNSSLFWSTRAVNVRSVEHNEMWYQQIHKQAEIKSLGFDYILAIDQQTYISSLINWKHDADIIIIDGNWRTSCTNSVIDYIKDGGGVMLIFDNSDWYPLAIKNLREKLQWIQLDFHGFGPINNYTWTTSVFINPIKANLIRYSRPLMSVRGLQNNTDET